MRVRLTDFSAKWKVMFQDEAEVLKRIFRDQIISCEHFGSTAIPGMKAKPVIDMMVIVKDINQVDTYNERMKSLGYDVAGEWGIKGRRLFRKGGEYRTHHIHFYQYDHLEIDRHLIFRDYLLAHPNEAKRYSDFKEYLSKKYEYTPDYRAGKQEIVAEIEGKALAWARTITS